MMTFDDYLSLPYRMEIVEDVTEGGYVISFPELPGCLTSGETIEAALENAKDAKKEWIRAALESGIPIAKPIEDNDFSGQFKLRIPKSLHRQLAENAKREGISMNQYCLYLLTRNSVVSMNKRGANN